MTAVKTCLKCGHEHQTIPDGGKPHWTGYYFQCAGGCNSTLLIPAPGKASDKPKITEELVK